MSIDPGWLQAALARERGPIAAVRAWPTWLRGTVAAIAALAGIAACDAIAPRARPGPVFVALVAGAAAALWAALRPVHRPPLARGVEAAIVVAGAIVLPLAAAAWLEAGERGASAVACFGRGVTLALPLLAVAWAIDRSGARGRGWLYACFAGLVAIAELSLLCPDGDPVHLLLGHATLVAALGQGYSGWLRSSGIE